MELQLFNRSLALSPPTTLKQWHTTRQLDSLRAAPEVRFDNSPNTSASSIPSHAKAPAWAHRAGVNALAIDPFEGRFLLSGGADASLHLWDLTSPSISPTPSSSSSSITSRPSTNTSPITTPIYHPLLSSTRHSSPHAHTHGLTSLSFYAFDSAAILTSSYDHTLKISPTSTLLPSASFPLGSIIHSHTMSPISPHVLVACATQSSVVKLVDLKSGNMTQGLLGHHGDVLNVSWNPRRENILASAGADGTVRLWDVRRSAGCIGMLDLEDEVGLLGGGRKGEKMWGRAHVGTCTSVSWSEDGERIVTAGHDERIRVWESATGRNLLVHFGAGIRNTRFAGVGIDVRKVGNREVVVWPNEREVLVGDLESGRAVRRLRPVGASQVAQAGTGKGVRGVKERVMGIGWRGSGYVEVYSAHADGVLRAWRPGNEDIVIEDEDEGEIGTEEVVRKRKALDEIQRDLTKQKVTFK